MKVFFTSIAMLLGFVVLAQNDYNEGIILEINDRSVHTDEFIKVYTKNASIIADEDKMSVDDYFELFKKYQLKLEAAYQSKLDEDPVFQKEYKKYYKQLADNYIANGDVTEKLVRETYQREVTQVKASHILVSVKANASPEDLEAAYTKATQIKKEIEEGADFETIAKKESQDPSAKVNGGNLGWFNGFKMVYPFENAVYNLALNEISEPVKTPFGYHIIKKTGERESIGKIKVAHIMIRVQQEDTLQKPETRIEEIYKKVEAGENFKDLAKQFSQDENTASKGGEMQTFGLGEINSQTFVEEAFNLNEDGQYSKPFKTRFGWHIIKRLGVESLDSYEDQKEELTRKIKTSERSKLLNDRIQEKIESQYKVTRNNEALNFLNTIVTDDVFKGKWQMKEDATIPEKVFLQIDDVSFSWKELATYIEKQQRAAKIKTSISALVQELADNYVYGVLLEHHKKYLPELDPEFAATIKEYESGLLLYEIMERQIWNPAKQDSIALEQYYSVHAPDYKTEESITVEIASFSKKKEAKQFLKNLANDSLFSSSARETKQAIFQEKEAKKTNSTALSKKLKFETGISKIHKHNGQYLIYNIHQVNPVRQLEFDEVKGRVISDYQNQLEEEWISDLQSKYELIVHENQLEKVRKEFE